jgi:hypothetical protein
MKNKANIAAAIVLIALGFWFLAVQLVPGLKEIAYGPGTWPLNVIAVGGLLALIALVMWVPGLMIPAAIVSGIGGLLFWQNQTGNWASWAYVWTLIPGFVGIGLVVAGLMNRSRATLTAGGWTLFNSLVLFIIFGAFLGGGQQIFNYWPVLLIALGIIILGRGILRR